MIFIPHPQHSNRSFSSWFRKAIPVTGLLYDIQVFLQFVMDFRQIPRLWQGVKKASICPTLRLSTIATEVVGDRTFMNRTFLRVVWRHGGGVEYCELNDKMGAHLYICFLAGSSSKIGRYSMTLVVARVPLRTYGKLWTVNA